MSDVDDVLNIGDLKRRQLETRIKDMYRSYSSDRPRSKQRALGPSEIGSICKRQLAFGSTAPRQGKGHGSKAGDPWRSLVGVAMHELAEDVLRWDNERQGSTVWIPEAKVKGHDEHPGTCDVYSTEFRTVVDHKFPGLSMFTHYKNHGPSLKYRVQVQIYALGYERLGFDVENVGIMFISPGSDLGHGFLWLAKYEPSIARMALDNLNRVKDICKDLEVDRHPERFAQIPITPSDECRFCDYFSPRPKGPRQCDGKH